MTEIRDTLIHKNGTSKSLPVRQMALVEVSKNLYVEKLQNTSKLFFFYIVYHNSSLAEWLSSSVVNENVQLHKVFVSR